MPSFVATHGSDLVMIRQEGPCHPTKPGFDRRNMVPLIKRIAGPNFGIMSIYSAIGSRLLSKLTAAWPRRGGRVLQDTLVIGNA